MLGRKMTRRESRSEVSWGFSGEGVGGRDFVLGGPIVAMSMILLRSPRSMNRRFLSDGVRDEPVLAMESASCCPEHSVALGRWSSVAWP